MTITNEELLTQLHDAIARAEAAVTAANAAATTANAAAAANQASAGAIGGVAGARTQSNAEVASLNDAIQKIVSQQNLSDIDVPELMSALTLLNSKRTYDLHQTEDWEGFNRNRVHFDHMVTQLQTHHANVNQLTLQSLANNQNQSNLNNTLSIDRSWNINETDLAAKSAAIITDKILAAMATQQPVAK